MKIAITGKGGVGKTTIAALLARYMAGEGINVIAVDADPDANLASALGIAAADTPQPISEMRELIEERTGAKGGYGEYFKINPKVDDIPDKYCATMENLKLLVLGGVRFGGGGCICPEGVLLKSLVMHLVLGRKDAVILDMEAGIEHLGRATAQGVDAMIIVVEPGARSIQTAHTIRRLANEIAIPRIGVVVNKFMPQYTIGRVAGELDGLPVLGTLPYDESIRAADVENVSPYNGDTLQRKVIGNLYDSIREFMASSQ